MLRFKVYVQNRPSKSGKDSRNVTFEMWSTSIAQVSLDLIQSEPHASSICIENLDNGEQTWVKAPSIRGPKRDAFRL